MPANPLWALAERIAEWRQREGFAEYDRSQSWPWSGDLWRANGVLPSGDRFDLRMVCDADRWPYYPLNISEPVKAQRTA